MCDPAQADSVTECGSTWPEMALLSRPRLGTTARRGERRAGLLAAVAAGSVSKVCQFWIKFHFFGSHDPGSRKMVYMSVQLDGPWDALQTLWGE